MTGVTIDPDSTRHVERLAALVRLHGGGHPYATLTAERCMAESEALRNALKAFNKRPAEPLSLGSLVEDRDRDVWVRHRDGSWSCLMGRPGVDVRTWDELCEQYGPIVVQAVR